MSSFPRFRVRPVLALVLSALLGLSAVGMSAPQSAEATGTTTTRTVTLTPNRVTYTNSAAPATNYASSRTMYASKSVYSTYLGFAGVSLQPGETITGVSLTTYFATIQGTGKSDFAVIPVQNSWSATQVTHQNQPAATGAKVNLNGNATVRQTATFRLDPSRTASAVKAGSSFRLMNQESNAEASLHGYGTYGPKLVVTISKSEKLVFAHYFPPYPVSIDNRTADTDYYARHYLVPEGENGKFADVGGLLRDRPIPRAPLTSTTWRKDDLKTEVRQAMAAGIDGFAVDILNITGANWDRTVMLMEAAAEVSPSFRIMLQPDATASTGKASHTDLAAALAKLAKYPSAYKLSDGRVVISPFKAENKTPAQWTEVMKLMETQHGVRTAFLPLFLDAGKMAEYASISIGFGNWGARDPIVTANGTDYAAQAHSLGKLWMQPVAVQDVRPNGKLYYEAGNTEQLRASWAKAINHNADIAMLVTWNDYSEGTHFAPSTDHGHTFLDISKYYGTRFKTGSYPAITTDTVHITHRVHRHDAQVSYLYPMKPWVGTRTQPRNTVEVMTSLKASATVNVTVGTTKYSYTAPAGVSTKLFPLQDGYTTATATRSGVSVASVKTKDPVTTKVVQQDMTYHAVSSGR